MYLQWDIQNKGDRRVALFLSKCKNGEKHELVDGSSVVFVGIKPSAKQKSEPITVLPTLVLSRSMFRF